MYMHVFIIMSLIRSLALKVRRVFKANPLAAQGFAPSLVTWLGVDVLGLKDDDSEEFAIVASDGLAFNDGETDLIKKWSKVCWWPANDTSAEMTTLEAVLKKEFCNSMKVAAAVKEHLQDSANQDFLVMSRCGLPA